MSDLTYFAQFPASDGSEWIAVLDSSQHRPSPEIQIPPTALHVARGRVWVAPAGEVTLPPGAAPRLMKQTITALRGVLAQVNQAFIQRQEEALGYLLALATGQHVFALGDPGSGKSSLVAAFGQAILPTPGVRASFTLNMPGAFSEAELFGGVDPFAYQQGEWRLKPGALATAYLPVLEEVGKTDVTVLNKLLLFLADGHLPHHDHRAPALVVMGTANELLPQGESDAFYDRFAIRIHIPSLPETRLFDLMGASGKRAVVEPVLDPGDLSLLAAVTEVQGMVLGQMLARGQAPELAEAIRLAFSVAADEQGAGQVTNRRMAEIIGPVICAHALLRGHVAPAKQDVAALRFVLPMDPSSALAEKILGVTDPVAGKLLTAAALLEEVKARIPSARSAEAVAQVSRDVSRLLVEIDELLQIEPASPEGLKIRDEARDLLASFQVAQASNLRRSIRG